MHIIPKIITIFLIFSVILIIPESFAQTESVSEVDQKLVKVRIDEKGNVKVIHQIANSNEPRILKFIDGTVSNLEIIDSVGKYESVNVFEGITGLPILENQGQIFVRYDLNDALILKNNTWTLDFRYLEKTTFYFPDDVNMVYVNGNPVIFKESKGFVCHGCQMILEYTIGEEPVVDEEPIVAVEEPSYIVEVIECGWWDNFLAIFGIGKC